MEKNIVYFFVTNADKKKISCDYLDPDDALDDFMDIDEETYLYVKIVGYRSPTLLLRWEPGMEDVVKTEEYYDYYYD